MQHLFKFNKDAGIAQMDFFFIRVNFKCVHYTIYHPVLKCWLLILNMYLNGMRMNVNNSIIYTFQKNQEAKLKYNVIKYKNKEMRLMVIWKFNS